MSPTTWTQVHLKARTEHAPGLASFELQGHHPEFSPGQFVQLALEIGGERVGRPYSLSGAPGQPWRTLIVRVPGGALTPALFELPIGAPLWVHTQPTGYFGLDRVPDAPTLWLIATGTGLAPFLSMLRAGTHRRFGRTVVVHGVRERAHLACAQEIQDLGATHIPVVSRQDTLPGQLSGRITGLLESGALEQAACSSLGQDAQVLMCGNPAMIQELFSMLQARGLTKNRPRSPGNLTFEAYW